jgi:anti-anti-sigma regulatory factor
MKKKPAAAAPVAGIELAERVSIAQAADLHAALVARLAAGGNLVIDGGRVQEIDTAILQMLASLWRSARERRTSCTWLRTSDALRESARLIGLAGELGLQESSTSDARDAAA